MNFQILGVVSLPDFAFRKAGSGMKTCLLFIRKYPSPYQSVQAVPNYKVFFAIANHIGYDSTLRPDSNDLPAILAHFRDGTEDRANGSFWLNLHSLDYRLDPTYYYNKFEIAQEFAHLKELGHTLVPLRSLIADMSAGKSPEGGVTRSSGEIPSLTISNITREGVLDFSAELNFVPESFYQDFVLAKGGLKYLDLLVAKDGATTGKTAIVDDNFPFLERSEAVPTSKAVFSEHVFRLRMKQGVNPLFVHAFLNSRLGQLQLETVTSGGAQGGITRGFIDDIMVPLVGEHDQQRISAAWQQGMRRSDSLRRDYEQSLLQQDRHG